METKLKIGIGIPTYGTIKTDTIHCVFKLLKTLPYEWKLLTQTGSYIQHNRIKIAKAAIQLGCTHLLYIDHDMYFEPEAVEKLIKDDKDIVGVDFNYRKLPLQSVTKYDDPDGTHIEVKHKDGVHECCGIGTGFALIKTSVFSKVQGPWFFIAQDEDGNVIYSEDMWFCHYARAAGFKIWCDSTLKVGHIGEYMY